nr:hypothetical protein [Tanacetum cinerariifolium]
MCEMFCQIVQKKQEEKRIKEEQAASARYWKIPACCDDDDDYDSAITPILSTKEPIDSLNEVIKSSVEDLVPIPSEFEGIPDTMCDVHFVNNPTPLETKDHVEIVINSNDDISSSDDDSLHEENIEYVDASPHDSELVSLEVAEIVTPEEPVDSLSMGDEHLDTIPATESDEVIKSSVENLVPIPSESEGILEHMCDVPFHDNYPPLDVSKDQIEDFSESINEVSSIDDDSFSIDNINYVEASPPDSELVSSEVIEIVSPKVGGIDDDIPLTIKDDNLRKKLSNVNLLIATIEALNDNPTPSS